MLRIGTANQRLFRRALNYAPSSKLTKMSLKEEWPGIPALKPLRDMKTPETLVTRLSSGLTVASHEKYETVSAIGVFIGSGSINEQVNEYGSAFILENMAFKSTENSSHSEMIKRLEDIGATVTKRSGRDFISIIVETLRDNVGECVRLLSETITQPRLLDEEIQDATNILGYFNENRILDRDYLTWSTDFLHAAMFGANSPYGHGISVQPPAINAKTLRSFWSKHYVAPNICLVGVNVDHDQLTRCADASFHFPTSQPPQDVFNALSAKDGQPPVQDNRIVKGGSYCTELEGMDMVEVDLGFHTNGWLAKDMVALNLLQMILGGGKMFSAGGPGKGMYSRLYKDVMNRYGWFESCEITMLLSRLHGIATLRALVPPSFVAPTTKILCDHIRQLAAEPLSDDEFQRAKNQFESRLYMNLEERAVVCEDIGNHLLTYGRHVYPEEWSEQINAITKEDVMKAVQGLLELPPAYAVFGCDVNKEYKNFPPIEGIQSYLQMPYK